MSSSVLALLDRESDEATLVVETDLTTEPIIVVPVKNPTPRKRGEYLPRTDEQALAIRIEGGDTSAATELVQANLHFVQNIARQYQGRGLPYEDLVHEGVIGMLEATQKFDYRRGTKFISYAGWWVRKQILFAIPETGQTIRIPKNRDYALGRLVDSEAKLRQKLERMPTQLELAKYMGLSEEEIREMYMELQLKNPSSLNGAGGLDPDTESGEMIKDLSAVSPETHLITSDIREQVNNALSMLSPRERLVVEMRFGLNGYAAEHTLEQIGAVVSLTKERIRQIELQAKNRLRPLLAEAGLDQMSL